MNADILVRLAKDMRPKRRGEDYLLPYEVARDLLRRGDVTDPRTRDGEPIDMASMEPRRTRRAEYLTK